MLGKHISLGRGEAAEDGTRTSTRESLLFCSSQAPWWMEEQGIPPPPVLGVTGSPGVNAGKDRSE